MTITNLVFGFLFAVTPIVLASPVLQAETQESPENQIVQSVKITPKPQIATSTIPLNDRIALYSRLYGVSSSKARNILGCESSFVYDAYNVNRDGSIDYSYWQINDRFWKDTLKGKFDITDPDQNLEAGFYLLATYGDSLWNPSRACWEKK